MDSRRLVRELYRRKIRRLGTAILSFKIDVLS